MQKGLQTELILNLPEALTGEMKLAFASAP
jgi:hypothetical protein